MTRKLLCFANCLTAKKEIAHRVCLMRHMCLCVCLCVCVHPYMCACIYVHVRRFKLQGWKRSSFYWRRVGGGEKRRGKPQRVSGGAKIIQENTLSSKGFFSGFSIILKNSLQVSSCL